MHLLSDTKRPLWSPLFSRFRYDRCNNDELLLFLTIWPPEKLNKAMDKRVKWQRQQERKKQAKRARNQRRRRKQGRASSTQTIGHATLSAEAKPFMPINTSRLPIVATTNARSINNKADLLNQLLDDAKIDVAVVTETWLHEANNNLFEAKMSDNHTTFSHTRSGRRGGGVAVLIRREYTASCSLVSTSGNIDQLANDINLEFIIAKARPPRLPRGYPNILICGVYIAEFNDKQRQQQAIAKLISALEEALDSDSGSRSERPLIVIAGDFNGANIKPLCSVFQLHQLNKTATRGDRCLDLILSNAPQCYNCENWPELGSSDHKTVVAIAPEYLYREQLPPPVKRYVRTGKIGDTVNEIRNTDWSQTISLLRTDPQGATNSLYETLKAAEDHHQPLRVMRQRNDKPFMTFELKQLISKRQKAYKQRRMAEYKELQNRIRRMLRKRKRKYIRNKFKSANRLCWSEIRSIAAPKGQHSISEESTIQINNNFHHVWYGRQPADLSRFCKPNVVPPNPPIFSYTNVHEQLKRLTSSSPGPDGLSTMLLKSSRLETVEVLTAMFNTFIEKSFVPEQWKCANITPIPKVQHPREPSDYRPISLTSNLCKTFERILAKHIVRITSHIWSDNEQYGFLPGKSTMDAIVQVINDWGQAKDCKDEVFAVFFDFSKAFDLVDHEILLSKLEALLPEWLCSWLASYLSNRKQRVKINDKETEWKEVVAGVIQGSVLGPILFILFISDINGYLPPGTNLKKYADDILAYLLGKRAPNYPQQIADGVEKWCQDNNMRLNEKKCKVIFIKNSASDSAPVTTLGGEALEIVNSYKYLGVDINDQLDWTQQWTRIQRKIVSIPYLLKQLRFDGFKEEILVTVYRSCALSHIVYSSPALISTSAAIKDEMERYQRRALRIIGISEETALKKYGIVTVEQLIEHSSITTMRRILNDPSHPLTNKLKRDTSRTTRSTFRFELPVAHTETYNNSVVLRCVRAIRDGQTNLYNPVTLKAMAKKIKAAQRKEKIISGNRAKHVDNTNSNKCDHCGKQFDSSRGLKIHQSKMHK